MQSKLTCRIKFQTQSHLNYRKNKAVSKKGYRRDQLHWGYKLVRRLHDCLLQRIQDVGSNKGKCHKKLKLRPRQIHTYIYNFTLLRWDPVTLRKDEDKKQNSNKQLLRRQLVDHKRCALQKNNIIFCLHLILIYLSFLPIKMDLGIEYMYIR